ncbi:unnamed protein product [Haemonchus placei]|uniref:Uncharacterized protein n=1 Tax=Haemonchus placei TaxID=6290 RepID=A0A0N4W2A2_HAEPC|nr:unnamed protein product [Haemonchus placei]
MFLRKFWNQWTLEENARRMTITVLPSGTKKVHLRSPSELAELCPEKTQDTASRPGYSLAGIRAKPLMSCVFHVPHAERIYDYGVSSDDTVRRELNFQPQTASLLLLASGSDCNGVCAGDTSFSVHSWAYTLRTSVVDVATFPTAIVRHCVAPLCCGAHGGAV